MDNLTKVIGLIQALLAREKPWWGKIEISIEGKGGIVNLKVTENIKL